MSKQPGMRRRKLRLKTCGLAPLLTIALITSSLGQTAHPLAGSWLIEKDRSTDIDPWRSISLTIESSESTVSIFRDLGAGRDSRKDTLVVPTSGEIRSTVVPASTKWLEQPHLGVFFDGTTEQHVSGVWFRPGRELTVTVSTTLQTSQAQSPVEIIRRFLVSEDGTELNLLETRSTRPRPIHHVYKRQ